jgi:hypothetical protein
MVTYFADFMEHEKLKKTKPFAVLREGYLRHPLQVNKGIRQRLFLLYIQQRETKG